MELIRTHDAMNFVALPVIVEDRHAGPEARDFQHQFGPVEPQKFGIVGDLEVLPDVVCDRTAYMALKERIVRYPALRPWVQVQCIGFLLSIAPTLPRKRNCSPGYDLPELALRPPQQA
jgi:hypothetical protein